MAESGGGEATEIAVVEKAVGKTAVSACDGTGGRVTGFSVDVPQSQVDSALRNVIPEVVQKAKNPHFH